MEDKDTASHGRASLSPNETPPAPLLPSWSRSDSAGVSTALLARKASARPQGQQLALQFGQRTHIECRPCGMSYDCRDEDDCAVHARFHLSQTHGIEWPFGTATVVAAGSKDARTIGTHRLRPAVIKSVLATAASQGAAASAALRATQPREMLRDDCSVALLAFDAGASADCRSIAVRQALARVEISMDAALGAVPLHLFGSIGEARQDRKKEQRQEDRPGVPAAPPPLNEDVRRALKLVVAIWRNRVVGSALVGPVPQGTAWRAGADRASPKRDAEAVASDNNDDDDDFLVSRARLSCDETPPLGVYRIHVVPALRRAKLGSALLDAALNDCIYGVRGVDVVAQRGGRANTLAFSQLTRDGRALANAWIRGTDIERRAGDASHASTYTGIRRHSVNHDSIFVRGTPPARLVVFDERTESAA